MPTIKKPAKRRSPKTPTIITGKDAFILSFVARNGVLSPKQHREIEKYLSPEIHIAISQDKGSGKRKGQKTLFQLRRLAQSNNSDIAEAPRGSRKRLGLFKAKSAVAP